MKQLVLLMAPVATVSGYGARSRDIALSLIRSGKYEVKIWPTRWGSTPMNALNEQDPNDKLIIDCLLANPNLDRQPDIFIQITVPNEFQRIGKFNIGITAGIETTIAAAPWIEGCNRMDLVLTSSEHAKTTFLNSSYEQKDKAGNHVGILKIEKPIEVLFEGVDLEKYFHTKEIHKSVIDALSDIKENFAFLFVGHWLNGDFGEDRKNISGLVKTFIETFKHKGSTNKPALILKTSHADFSPVDKADVLNKLTQIYKSCTGNNLPNVYVLHGDLTDEEMNSLYNHPKVKAHISFTKGEGYGRPLAEASLSQKIIIASNWSGHLDFLKDGVLLPGELKNVHPSAAWKDVILQESQWFAVDYGYASNAMKAVYDNLKDYEVTAKKQATRIRKEFNLDAMAEKLLSYIEQYVPKHVQPVLPQLKKVEKSNTIELPKLKKITN